MFVRLSVCLALIAGTLLIYSQPWQKGPAELISWGPPALMPSSMMREVSKQHEMKWGPPAIRPRAKTRHPIRKNGVTLDLNIKDNKIAAPVTINLFAPTSVAAQAVADEKADQKMQAAIEESRPKLARDEIASGVQQEARQTSQVIVPTANAGQQAEAALAPQQLVQQPAVQEKPKMSAKAVLEQLTALEKVQKNTMPKFDDKIMTLEQLAERERTLQAQVSDMRQSVVTEAGVKKLHQMEQQLADVRKEILVAPKLLPKKLEEVEKRMTQARADVEHLREKIYNTENDLKAANAKDDKGERELEAKVELLRAQQDALADIMGRPAPHHKPMAGLAEGLKIQEEISRDKKSLSSLKAKLQSAEETLAQLQKDRDELDADMRQVENVREEKARMVMLAGEEAPSTAAAPAERDADSEDDSEKRTSKKLQVAADPNDTPEMRRRRKELAAKDEDEKIESDKAVPLRTFDTVRQQDKDTPGEVQQVGFFCVGRFEFCTNARLGACR
jgi:hypothetical protein